VIHIVWAFTVRAEAVERFVALYGPEGDWVRLFARHPGYRGTDLLRDEADPRRFLTVDRWDSHEDMHRMKETSAQEYARLDALGEALTESESRIGVFETT
jgi:heme-degrading monooxygenase HmoA